MSWFDKPRQRHNMVCPWWLCYSFDNPLRRVVHDPVQLFGGHIGPGMTVLDIGCGMGHFTTGLANLVGDGGKIVAVDLQQQMLNALQRRARKAGVAHRIVLHQCRKDGLVLDAMPPFDFALAFWMVHEVPDQPRFFNELFAALKPEGRLLLVEPRIHVSLKSFKKTRQYAEAAGFRLLDEPAIALSRTLLMRKEKEKSHPEDSKNGGQYRQEPK